MLIAGILAILLAIVFFVVAVFFKHRSMTPVDPMSGTEFGSPKARTRQIQDEISRFFGTLTLATTITGVVLIVASFF